jgi:hypothetical protein
MCHGNPGKIVGATQCGLRFTVETCCFVYFTTRTALSAKLPETTQATSDFKAAKWEVQLGGVPGSGTLPFTLAIFPRIPLKVLFIVPVVVKQDAWKS